jgi:uncharacterized protein (TIGR03067 family)
MRRYTVLILLFTVIMLFSWCGKEEESVIGEEEGMGESEEEGEFVERVDFKYEGLIGEWEGKEKGKANSQYTWTFKFDGDRFNCNSTLGEFYEGTMTIDEGVEPASLDFNIEDSYEGEYNDMKALGIFMYEEGVLSIALNKPGLDERPERFSTESGARVWKLERVK